MLIRRPLSCPLPVIEKRVRGEDVSDRGAFFCEDTIEITLRVSRALGAAGVVFRLFPDGGAGRDLPLSFVGMENGTDTYVLRLPLSTLCAPRGYGLFFYEFLFLRGADTLFTDAKNQVEFSLSSHSAGRFHLSVVKNGISTPRWFAGGVMYHIFVDRFFAAGGERRGDAVYHENWEEDIFQFGAYPGAPVANNEFYGGTLWGVLQKLDRLESLGVTVLYLSPVFRAASNHKYDTGDYETVDPQFGGEEALRALLAECHRRGMRVILDGVFNHTGDDSRYFNRLGHYDTLGAYQSLESPYAHWYFFKQFPEKYECWWGVKILPKLNLDAADVRDYFVGEGGIADRYLNMGVDGWRLDVADELPDLFLDKLRERVKAARGEDGLVIGEVWENAAEKIAYDRRRRYFISGQLDSVMNYPLRKGILSFVRDGDASSFAAVLRELWGTYPRPVCHSLMNLLSTHDTERILTVLGGVSDKGYSNAELRDLRMSPAEYRRGRTLLQMASLLQYTVFGVPCIFYGDEAGVEGYHDPFCRRTYPWGREDRVLLRHYQRLGRLRQAHSALADGDFRILFTDKHALMFERKNREETLIVAANRGGEPLSLTLPWEAEYVFGVGKKPAGHTLEPYAAAIWRIG